MLVLVVTFVVVLVVVVAVVVFVVVGGVDVRRKGCLLVKAAVEIEVVN